MHEGESDHNPGVDNIAGHIEDGRIAWSKEHPDDTGSSDTEEETNIEALRQALETRLNTLIDNRLDTFRSQQNRNAVAWDAIINSPIAPERARLVCRDLMANRDTNIRAMETIQAQAREGFTHIIRSLSSEAALAEVTDMLNDLEEGMLSQTNMGEVAVKSFEESARKVGR